MHWRRFAVSSIPLATPEEFDLWLQERWLEKEKLLEVHALTGQFPSSLPDGKALTTDVRLGNWLELWRVGGILASVVTTFTLIPALLKRLF